MAHAIIGLAEESAQVEQQQLSLVPVSAASNNDLLGRPAGAQSVAAGGDAEVLQPHANARLEQTALDLLSLHAALTRLQGVLPGSASPTGSQQIMEYLHGDACKSHFKFQEICRAIARLSFPPWLWCMQSGFLCDGVHSSSGKLWVLCQLCA